MNESLKVQPHHLERAAYLYVRQSSMKQVIENVESTKRQYALRARATALGWPDDRVIVIDSDQGESGASAAWREGFQRLVSEVGLGSAKTRVTVLRLSRAARCTVTVEPHIPHSRVPGSFSKPQVGQLSAPAVPLAEPAGPSKPLASPSRPAASPSGR